MTFQYKVVPAPTRGRKARGVKTPADRFAHALEELINELAADGWEYIRTDTLPAEERHGLTKRTTVYQNMLVFRRGTKPEPAAEPLFTQSVKPAVTAAPAAPAPAAPTPAPAAPAPRVEAVKTDPPAKPAPLTLRAPAPETPKPAPADTAGAAPKPDPAAASTPAPTPAPAPHRAPVKSDLSAMIASEIAAARAPKLPSAGAAQSMPENRASFPGAGHAKRDVAAE